MPTTHLSCPECKGEFDYVLGVESYLVHTPGNVVVITSDGAKQRSDSIKVWNKHYIMCPYCKKSSWFKVKLR